MGVYLLVGINSGSPEGPGVVHNNGDTHYCSGILLAHGKTLLFQCIVYARRISCFYNVLINVKMKVSNFPPKSLDLVAHFK